jgi:hypothetical protein
MKLLKKKINEIRNNKTNMNLILDFQQLKRTSGLRILNVQGTKLDNVKDVERSHLMNIDLLMCSSFILLYDLSKDFEYKIIKCRYSTKKEIWNGSENVIYEFKPKSLSDVYDFLKDIDNEIQKLKNSSSNFYEKDILNEDIDSYN